jgi:hypothetical protein
MENSWVGKRTRNINTSPVSPDAIILFAPKLMAHPSRVFSIFHVGMAI